MTVLKGINVVNSIADGLRADVAALAERGITPTLGVLRVGERPDDLAYEAGLKKRLASVGAAARVTALPAGCSQAELESALAALNADGSIHGILVFRPLPKPLDEAPLARLIAPEKDVDCFSPASLAAVFTGKGEGFAPCTPQAVIELADFYGIALAGKRVTLVGRSLVVGKPLAMLLLARNATVTVCHTRTVDLPAECRRAEVLICAAGSPRVIGADCASEGQTVIDVGINMLDGKLCGDADYEAVAAVIGERGAITPVPGGVGAVTSSVLAKHVVEAAKKAALASVIA